MSKPYNEFTHLINHQCETFLLLTPHLTLISQHLVPEKFWTIFDPPHAQCLAFGAWTFFGHFFGPSHRVEMDPLRYYVDFEFSMQYPWWVCPPLMSSLSNYRERFKRQERKLFFEYEKITSITSDVQYTLVQLIFFQKVSFNYIHNQQ